MKLTRVEAPSMKEALLKIKTTLGADAMIVGTRTLRRGGVLGVGGREVVEVYVTQPAGREPEESEAPDQLLARAARLAATAAPRNPHGTRPVDPSSSVVGPGTPGEALEALRSLYPAIKNPYAEPREGSSSPSVTLPPVRGDDDPVERLARFAREKGWKVDNFPRPAPAPARTPERSPEEEHPFVREARLLLEELEVSPKISEGLLWDLRTVDLPVGEVDPHRLRTLLKAQVIKLLVPPAPLRETPGQASVQLFLGPTGVGKTTTVAKLAARAKINERKRVGLITLDTFRIAAVDQLQKYAGIIGITLEVVSDPVEFRSAVARLRREGLDTILVDTAGRGQRDELKMRELGEFVKSTPEARVHLVLSTTTHPRTFSRVARRFIPLGVNCMILTKLDESESFGALLDPLVEAGLPVSYITDGQNVPDDIMPSDPERLTDLVFRTRAL